MRTKAIDTPPHVLVLPRTLHPTVSTSRNVPTNSETSLSFAALTTMLLLQLSIPSSSLFVLIACLPACLPACLFARSLSLSRLHSPKNDKRFAHN